MTKGLALSTVLVAVAACKQSTPADTVDTQKDPASATADTDRPDAPASIAGAYLTCLVAKPKVGDATLNAGCQLRGPTKLKVDCKDMGKHAWTYVPPKTSGSGSGSGSAAKNPDVEIFNLCADPKKNYYFQVGMRMKIAKAEPAKKSLALTGGKAPSGLALSDTQRERDAEFFLGLRPVVVFNPTAKGSGLALAGPSDPAAAPKQSAIVSKGDLRVETNRVIQAKDGFAVPAAILAAVEASGAAIMGGVFDPTAGKVDVLATEPTVQNQSGSDVLDVLTPLDNAQPSEPIASETIDADPYFSGGVGTPPPTLTCAEALPDMTERFNKGDLDAKQFGEECRLYCDEADCATPGG